MEIIAEIASVVLEFCESVVRGVASINRLLSLSAEWRGMKIGRTNPIF